MGQGARYAHVACRPGVSDLERSLAFYTAVGYTVAGTVQGTVQPALAGSAIQLQLADGSGWTTVAAATTDAAGSFAVAASLTPGSYRVRCAPGHGLSPGVSQALSVP